MPRTHYEEYMLANPEIMLANLHRAQSEFLEIRDDFESLKSTVRSLKPTLDAKSNLIAALKLANDSLLAQIAQKDEIISRQGDCITFLKDSLRAPVKPTPWDDVFKCLLRSELTRNGGLGM